MASRSNCVDEAYSVSSHFLPQVHHILAELCMGGMVLETNMTEILARVEDQSKLEKQEVCIVSRTSSSASFSYRCNSCMRISHNRCYMVQFVCSGTR